MNMRGYTVQHPLLRFLSRTYREYQSALLWMFCSVIFFYLIFPVLILFPVSFFASQYTLLPPSGYSLRWYQEFLSNSDWIDSAFTSIKIALLTSVCACVIGGLASLALVRGNWRSKDLLSSLMISPMIVPTILVGVASFFTLSSLGIKGDISGYVLIYTMLSLPIVVIVISSRLQSFDVALEEAANNLGANRWGALWHVTLPIISPAVFVAAVFAFNVAFEEAIIVMFISKPGVTTLPNQMYNTLIEDASLVVAAVSSLQIVATVSIFGAAALVGKNRS